MIRPVRLLILCLGFCFSALAAASTETSSLELLRQALQDKAVAVDTYCHLQISPKLYQQIKTSDRKILALNSAEQKLWLQTTQKGLQLMCDEDRDLFKKMSFILQENSIQKLKARSSSEKSLENLVRSKLVELNWQSQNQRLSKLDQFFKVQTKEFTRPGIRKPLAQLFHRQSSKENQKQFAKTWPGYYELSSIAQLRHPRLAAQ